MAVSLTCRYLGLELQNPFLVGASPLIYDLDLVRRLEDAGAAALVMHSLFAEQIEREAIGSPPPRSADSGGERSRTYFPVVGGFPLAPQAYLEHLQRLKERVGIPVIASLNGTSLGSWVDYGILIEEAGADALEINLYFLPGVGEVSGGEVEDGAFEIVRRVKERLSIPVAVKLSPAFTSLGHFSRRLAETGIEGLVLFNHFFQPEIDPERPCFDPHLRLPSGDILGLRLRWAATLHGRLPLDLAISGGVESARDGVKAIMAGASVVQIVSALMREGPEAMARVLAEFTEWIDSHGYDRLESLRGILSFKGEENPEQVARASYMEMLQRWNQRREEKL